MQRRRNLLQRDVLRKADVDILPNAVGKDSIRIVRCASFVRRQIYRQQK